MKKNIFITLILVLVSCAKKEQLSEVQIDFNQFASASNLSSRPTIILYGVSASGNTFTRILESGYFSSEIPSDIWDFHAIIWSGENGNFSGSSYCAKALKVDLSGGEVDVDVSMSSDNCSLYGKRNGDQFKNPVLKVLDTSMNSNCSILNNCLLTQFSAQYIVRESNNDNLMEFRAVGPCVDNTVGSEVNVISQKNIKHNSIGAFRIFREGGCDPLNFQKTISIGSSQMETVEDPISGELTIYLKI